jgi:hypothetical protein
MGVARVTPNNVGVVADGFVVLPKPAVGDGSVIVVYLNTSRIKPDGFGKVGDRLIVLR